jgi:hypothetical protein
MVNAPSSMEKWGRAGVNADRLNLWLQTEKGKK